MRQKLLKDVPDFFFYFGFLSWTFPIDRAAGEGAGYLFNSFLPLHPFHRNWDISQTITAESPPLLTASSQIQIGNLWFKSTSRYLLNYAPLIQLLQSVTITKWDVLTDGLAHSILISAWTTLSQRSLVVLLARSQSTVELLTDWS